MHPKQMQCQNEHASSKTNNMLENTETFKNLSQLVIQVTRPSLCHTCTQTLRTPLSVTFLQTSKSRRANPPFLCPLCQFMCVFHERNNRLLDRARCICCVLETSFKQYIQNPCKAKNKNNTKPQPETSGVSSL